MKKVLLIGIFLFGIVLSFGADGLEKIELDFSNPRSDKELIEIFKKDCDGGNASGCHGLGYIYENSKVLKHDITKSIKYYELAMKLYKTNCDNGDADACDQLSANYRYGYGGAEVDMKLATQYENKAARYHEKSCNSGNAAKCFRIANMYSSGEGVEQNNATAVKYYTKACNEGYIVGCRYLGYMYSSGKGVMKNSKMALKYSIKAAKQGDAFAQSNIGSLYYKGQGVRKNYIFAYAWYSLATSNGDDQTDMVDKLESIMTLNQIAIAQNYNPLKQESIKNQKDKKSNLPQISTGTGFFVNNSIVLTNHHVVKDCKNIEIIHKNYSAKAAKIADDSRNDLAILKASKENPNSLRFRAGKGIRIGEEIIVLGYPLGKLLGSNIKLTTGDISSLNGLVDDTTNLQITAPIQPGNSGGPLLDLDGNVVGVIYSRLDVSSSGISTQNINFAIKSYIAQVFLDTNDIDYKVNPSRDKRDVADIVDESKDSIIQVVCHQ